MKTRFQIVIEDAGFECMDYSGRAMYGKRCLGVSLDESVQLFTAKVMAAGLAGFGGEDEDLSDFVDIFESSSTDQLGLGQVIYFQDIKYSNEEPEED
jgi:hypothetical protein